MTKSPYRYKAFVSYSHTDAAWGKWLHRAIENYRIPAQVLRSHGLSEPNLRPIFLDREELSSAADLSESIRAALENSEYLIVVCSPEAAESRWVNQEIEAFIALGRGDKILCLLIHEDVKASLPPTLGNSEPLAADVRREADGRRNSVLKIVAGLLNVRFDELARRDQTRRQRRLTVVSIAASIGMAITSGLAGYAYLQREEAMAQRAAAREEAATSERIVEFLMSVFDAGDPDVAVGRDLRASELLKVGVAKLDSTLADEPKIQARLLSTLGQVHWSRDEIDVAGELIERSLKLKSTLLAPADDEFLRDVMLLALVRHAQGEFAAAEALYRQALDGKVALHGPTHRDVLIAMSNLGTLYEDTGRLDEALATGKEVLRIKVESLGYDDTSTIVSMVSLASAYGTSNQWDECRRLLDQAREVGLRILDENHPLILMVDENRAVLMHTLREYETEEKLRLDLVARKTLVLGATHIETLITQRNLALYYRDVDRLEQAQLLLGDVLRHVREKNGQSHPQTLRTQILLTEVVGLRGQLDQAIEDLRQILPALEGSVGPEHPFVVQLLSTLGEFLWRSGHRDDASAMLQRALELSSSIYGENDADSAKIRSLLAEIAADGSLLQ